MNIVKDYPTVWPYFLARTLGRLYCAIRGHKKWGIYTPMYTGNRYRVFCGKCRRVLGELELHTGV